MVAGCLSILSSSSSTFPSIPNSDTLSITSHRLSFSPPFRNQIRFPTRYSSPTSVSDAQRASKIGAAPNAPIRDGNAEQFLENNSIADFMRFQRKSGKEGSGELQTAVVRYMKRFPWSILHPFLQVDLLSTIHIADKEYFATLQKKLELYDCVLYEMVASRESLETRKNSTSVKKLKGSRSRGFSILGCIQRQMSRVLKLDFQLDCLDYQGDNWYHADLDYETFKLLQHERGENFFTFARDMTDMTLRSTKAIVQPTSELNLGTWRSKLLWASRVFPMPLVGLLIIGGVCAQAENQASDYQELEALSRLDFEAAMKVFLAKRLTSEFTEVTAAIEESSVIIGERNRVATEAVQRAIADGNKRIAVLYGGGHMPDLGRRLREEFDLIPKRVEWITAWSIKNQELDSQSLPFLKSLAEISGWPLNRYQTMALVIFSSFLAIDLWFWELFVGTVANWTVFAASEFGQLVQNIWAQ